MYQTAIKSFIKIPYNTLIDFKKSIVDISDAIKESSLKISLGNFTIYPNEQWIDGVSKSIRSFKLLYKIGEIDITKLKNYIINISNSILESSIIFEEVNMTFIQMKIG